ncbi:TPA: hypothetical protein N0F65_006804 [Lagenidium giganteum]|uniref:MTHFR SAM-binding regulatory domain-containing protein n=1 Tax=Lagenidium giganteum TaxID=4803 RepID=A0AAV2ZCC0_9STRA|nr:TPA: hypothetical protein N0F65_006804 [Lagenidium giganteum]
MKISEKIQQSMDKGDVFYSFEFFPPKTPAGVENLYTRMDRMASLEPLFCDMTWGAGGSQANLTIDISANAQRLSGLEMLMHMTCANMAEEDVKKALDKAKEAGIQNILALRGDPVRGATSFNECDRGFSHAVDLVRFIRKHYGDHFSIGVAGYPEGHSECVDKQTDIKYLKEKVDAGAQYVITQLFYDVNVYKQFVADCRAAGITCPIIPGIMPIQTYGGFVRMTSFCNTYVPAEITEALEPIKDNDEAVKDYGVKLGIEMSRQLMAADAPGLHFYTLNLERSVRRILEGLGFLANKSSRRELPWRPSTLAKRARESVRPIYWSNRPKSYLQRTASWDEFPNGRWGNSESPAFGDLSQSHYMNKTISPQERKAMWGEALVNKDDVHEVFVKYVRGEIKHLPWCDQPLHLETQTIMEKLTAANKAGFLTINSQPRVNAAPSDDPMFGWGGPGGRVYQKAYVECFVSPENMKKIIDNASAMKYIQYHAVDRRGNSYSNAGKAAIAVTWGVFPNKEILQPTIVDSNSFMAWKDEAFSLWLSMWASLYDDESKAAELIHEIHDSYFLVSIVDNDFVNGNIWDIFDLPKLAAPECIGTTVVIMGYALPRDCERVLRGHQGPVNAVRFNAKGTYVMTCGVDKAIRLWNPHRDGVDVRGEALLIKTYQGRHGYDVQDVTIGHDNAKFASCGRDKMVFLWDVPSGEVVRKFEGHSYGVNCVQFNANASVLLSGSYDKTIRLWDMRSRNNTPIQILDEFKDSVTSIAVSDHEIVAGCVDGIVRTFDLRIGKVYREHIEEPVISVALSPDGRCILAGSLDGSIRLIEKDSGTELKSYRGHNVQSYKIDCLFSWDGAFVTSGSEDGRVFTWDLVDGRMDSFQAHGKAVRTLACHPEDPMIITGCVDGSAKVWSISTTP